MHKNSDVLVGYGMLIVMLALLILMLLGIVQ
jgi:hypothetical protein